MDTIKIGNFLATLRKEQNLTQESLGEKLGVTNKTVSRWENGNYLPPVEMLQELGKLYAVSINEILCGERIPEEKYQVKAEETITGILSGSPFSFKERSDFWKHKWQRIIWLPTWHWLFCCLLCSLQVSFFPNRW